MTTLGTLLSLYLQQAWQETSPGTVDIQWGREWYDPHYGEKPQITFTEVHSPVHQRFSSGGSLTFDYHENFLVNCWQLLPAGKLGTAEYQTVDNMRKEICRVFRTGFPSYGGSLSPLEFAIPLDKGIPHHELDKTPRVLRFEVTLLGVHEGE